MQPADATEWPPPATLVARSPSPSRPPRPPRAAHDRYSEEYGLAGSITAVAYLAWAYAAEPWLRSLGVAYYPSKYWALAAPSFVVAAAYMGSNLLLTPPPVFLPHRIR